MLPFREISMEDRQAFEEALLASIPQKTIDMNKKAFELGYSAV